MLEYAWDQLRYGFACILNTNNDCDQEDESNISDDCKYLNNGHCKNSWVYIIGYTLSLFIIQLNINSIMHHKFTRNAQYIYAFMVPITVLAFYCAIETVGVDIINSDNTKIQSWDLFGIIVVGLGVFAHNFFKLKPQKASIEEDF